MHNDRLAFTRFAACSLAVSGALSIAGFTETLGASQSDGAISLDRLKPVDKFVDEMRSGGHGPEMIVIPAGQFRMGCAFDCALGYDVSTRKFGTLNQPARVVTFAQPFALSEFEVTSEDYERFVKATTTTTPDAKPRERQRQPKNHVSWHDAVAYVEWLSAETGAPYRLPSEAEWEYAARAGTTTRYHFQGDESQFCKFGNHLDAGVVLADLSAFPNAAFQFRQRNTACSDGIGRGTAEVGRYAPNDFGLYDMHGNVAEWTQDCWNGSYFGAPTDGRAWESGDCSYRVTRGGGWAVPLLPVAIRTASKQQARYDGGGFRVARTLHLHRSEQGGER